MTLFRIIDHSLQSSSESASHIYGFFQDEIEHRIYSLSESSIQMGIRIGLRRQHPLDRGSQYDRNEQNKTGVRYASLGRAYFLSGFQHDSIPCVEYATAYQSP